MNPFTALAVAFIVALPTGAYLVMHDHGILGAICIICPFLMGASHETKSSDSEKEEKK
jgi:hypothetical protein